MASPEIAPDRLVAAAMAAKQREERIRESGTDGGFSEKRGCRFRG